MEKAKSVGAAQAHLMLDELESIPDRYSHAQQTISRCIYLRKEAQSDGDWNAMIERAQTVHESWKKTKALELGPIYQAVQRLRERSIDIHRKMISFKLFTDSIPFATLVRNAETIFTQLVVTSVRK
jgi:hypothetical protein